MTDSWPIGSLRSRKTSDSGPLRPMRNLMTRIRALLRREERVCHQLVGFGRAVEGQKDERLLKRVWPVMKIEVE